MFWFLLPVMAVLFDVEWACTATPQQDSTMHQGFARFPSIGLCSVQLSCGWLKHDDNYHQLWCVVFLQDAQVDGWAFSVVYKVLGRHLRGVALQVFEPKAGSWHGQLHDSNPLRVTFKRGAEPSDPIPLFTLASPSPHPYCFIPPTAMPLLVPSALAADTVGGSSSISLSLSRPSSDSEAGPLLAASCAPAPCPDIPLEVTVRGAPVTSQHPSSPLEFESPPAELDADAAATTSSRPSPLASPITSIHSALLSELPSPMACVKALCALGTPSEGPKSSPLVNMSPRPALANLTNGLTPQVTLLSSRCILAKHCIA